MHKVTTINLNGRAYQLEDKGYEKLQAYLHHAEKSLAHDPDKAEVLADIEQAIADKCERALQPRKNVVSTTQIEDIIQEMGEVETEATSGDKRPEEEPNGASDSTKRLFVIKDGAMILGVCRGIGAYFGVDPTIVRLIFAFLAFATSGVWIVVYILLALVLPEAKTEADLSEAYGKPMTAQAILDRARERAPDKAALQNLSDGVMKLLRIAAKLLRVVGLIAFGIVTGAWLITLWAVLFGRITFYDQLQILNGWRSLLALTVAYLIIALPLVVATRILGRLADNQEHTRAATATEGSLAALWGISLVILVVLGISYAQNLRDYANAHQGNIDVGNSHICVDQSLCTPDFQPYYYR